MRILVDMDGVIADFEAGFLNRWRYAHPDKMYIPLEKRNTFYLLEQYPSEYRDLIWDIFLSPGFFESLNPIAGSLDALHEMLSLGIEVFICTSPFIKYENCVLEKYKWVDHYLGTNWVRRIILTYDKTIVNADFLIDDMPTVKGIAIPTWEHIIYSLPKNTFEQTKKRLVWNNWKQVMCSFDSFRRVYENANHST